MKDEVDLSPNHGWCVSGDEPKGTKISPEGYMQMLFELHIHQWSAQKYDDINVLASQLKAKMPKEKEQDTFYPS